MDGLNNIALLYDHLTNIRYDCVKILTILFWLSLDSIDCSFHFNASDSLEELADFSDIIKTTVAIIGRTLHYCVQ